MAATGKSVPVLTPVYGRKYKTKQECLEGYFEGHPFVLNLPGSQEDGTVVNISHVYFQVVKFRINKTTFTYEGN